MKRAGLFAAACALSFAVTLWVRASLATTAPPADSPSTERTDGPGDTLATPAPSRAQQQLATRRVVEVNNDGLTAFQKLSVEQPAEASALQNAVFEATAKDRYDRGANLEDCATSESVPGAQALRFATSVASDEQTFRASAWRFVEVVDGSDIPPEVIACMERALGGPYAGGRPAHARFPAGFEGDIDLVYRLQAFAAP